MDLVVLDHKAPGAQGRAPVHYILRRGASPEPHPIESALKTPLGSVWKLFAYFYLAENRIHPPRYACSGKDKEELFCCKPGDAIDLDEALSKSCGLYFSPKRIGLSNEAWKSFWTNHIHVDYEWLTALEKLRPQTNVPVLELLQALDSLSRFPGAFRSLNAALSRVVIDGTAKGAVRTFGLHLRAKTFTWDNFGDGFGNDPGSGEKFLGGFAGWLSRGSPVWGRGSGTSRQVLSSWARQIMAVAEKHDRSESGECVAVRFFDRYPLREVLELPAMIPARPGALNGKFRAVFASGQRFDLDSGGELRLEKAADGAPRVFGRFKTNEYVARVIDREIKPSPAEAARAFGIVIRSYLYQNAKMEKGCYSIADSTRFQRVSVNPASEAAVKAAHWSDGMVLKGVPAAHYHSTRSGSNLLGWPRAAEMARNGSFFDEILRSAFPSAQIAFVDDKNPTRCERLKSAESWLGKQRKAWTGKLSLVSGYQDPADVKICRSVSMQPYSDMDQNVIYARFTGEIEDQITMAHEFLHLAFKYHPQGLNEPFIEARARELVGDQRQGDRYEAYQ